MCWITGRVTSLNEESSTVNGTGTSRSTHSRISCSVSAGDVLTVSAVRVVGRVARAKARACSVGECSLETSTITWIRLGNSDPAGVGSSSMETRS